MSDVTREGEQIGGAVNERTRKSAFNFVTGLAGTAVTLAVSFVTTPLLLRFLGTEVFGAVRATTDWFGHLTLLELGLYGALAPLLAMALGRGDKERARATLAEGIRAYAKVALAACLAGLVITVMIERLVPVSPDLVRDLRIGCLIAVLGLCVYPLTPFRALADASQRGWLINAGSLIQTLVVTGLAVLLAWEGFGIAGQFAALIVGQALFTLLLARDGVRRLPGLAAAVRQGRDAQTRAQIRRLNLPSFLFDLSGRAGLMTDNIVIALVLGPTMVVPLFLTQRLLTLAQAQLQGIGNASWAALGELHALGRRDVFNARLIELTGLVSALGVSVLLPLAAFDHAFVRLWVGESRYGGELVNILAAVNALLLSIVSLWGWCFTGTGQVTALVPVCLAGATLNLGLSVAGAFAIGLPGPLLGTAIATLSTTFWYMPYQMEKRFGASAARLFRATLAPLAWAAIPGAGIVWLALNHPPRSWPMLAVDLAVSGTTLLLVWWIFELRVEERAHYTSRLSMALPGRRTDA
ncbi:MAG TPA: hypothetical protein VGI92_02560 [Gemmatimonadales bacterium]